MFGRPDPPQQWSVHAEFTISHPGADDVENPPQTNTVQGENGTRLSYSWTSKENSNVWPCPPQSNASSGSTSNRSVYSDVGKPFAYQRGNLLFTSTPPRKFSEVPTGISRLGVQDSGYGSDLLSPNSLASGSLPNKAYLPYNRKCKSTCSIVLSTNNPDKTIPEEFLEPCHVHCGRTQSLRCQTPALRNKGDNYNFYGCGDPWCHHSHMGDEMPGLDKTSLISETCDSPQVKATSPANTFTGGFHLPGPTLQKKDASVQTFEMIDKCTSPIIKTENFNENPMPYTRNIERSNRRNVRGLRRRNAQLRGSQPPSSFTPDSLDSVQLPKKLSRFPNFKKPASLDQQVGLKSASESSDPLKKPHTVHIDVYCTGTEMESDDSRFSDSSQNETTSTPQTVFESSDVCITHGRSESTKLPFHLKEDKNVPKKSNNSSIEKDDSDIDDGASTAYPSKISSYSTINDFSSSISSVPKSWTTYSLSSYTVPDDYDSVANTSWKDTFSDIDSLLHSSSSIAHTESVDFIPKKLYKNNLSIDETPEIENIMTQETSNNADLHPSDSFEYANSEDRLRITEMEEMWKSKSQIKPWRSPQSEKRLLLQQKKMQEYIKNRLRQQSKSKDSDSDSSDESEKGWTFIKCPEKKNERDLRLRESREKVKDKVINIENLVEQSNSQINLPSNTTKEEPIDQCSYGDSTQSTVKSPDADVLRRLSCDHTLRSPFSVLPGIYTEQRHIANRFGPVISTFRKPGHHIGPSKNPDCFCDHCQRHFKSLEYRYRTHSVGDSPSYQ